MRLFIAEKPSLGRAIADGLGGGSKRNGYIDCGKDVVTWCFGHLLEMLPPDGYDPEYKNWKKEHLPIIPAKWLYAPRKDAEEQLGVIGRLLSKASLVVNAGDPDREGQLLVDEVLEHHGYSGPAQRIWLASLDDASVKKALATLTDNAGHAPLRDSARARSRADWLVGLNCTRAMTIIGRSAGVQGVLSQGRVQTPTLGLVVARDLAIEHFKPVPYFVPQGLFSHPNGQFQAVFQPGEDTPGLDADGRLIDQAVAEGIIARVSGKSGIITQAVAEKKTKAPPLPHSLSSLQKAASAALSMSAQDVLNTAQALYEKKLTTYPRTDCRYLPDEQFPAAARILSALGRGVSALSPLTSSADPARKSKAWNTKKVTAHHGIIPTGEIPSGLSEKEQAIFLIVARSYALQFHAPMEYEARKIMIEVENTLWKATGRTVLKPGWTAFVKNVEEEDEEPAVLLPAVNEQDAVTCDQAQALSKKTTPPSRFTEGTLIEAMANVHRFIDDVEAKKTLKENEGIGTEATRANILETLKKRGLLAAEKKAIVSTPLGRQLIKMTPPLLKDPVTTAKWENRLEAIARGEETLADFMSGQQAALPELLNAIFSVQVGVMPGAYPCPECKKPLRRGKNKEGKWYWGCFNTEAHTSGKPVFLNDAKGKPAPPQKRPARARLCPECKSPLKSIQTRQGPCLACSNAKGHASGKSRYFKQ